MKPFLNILLKFDYNNVYMNRKKCECSHKDFNEILLFIENYATHGKIVVTSKKFLIINCESGLCKMYNDP